MTRASNLTTSLLRTGLAAGALFAGGALASSHREAPAISNDPAADNTDVYAWVTPGTHDKLNLIANYIPLEEPAGGPNFHTFSDNVRYEIHVTKGLTLNDFVVYRIEFSTLRPAFRDPATDPNNFAAVIGSGVNFFSQISGAVQTYTVKRIAANGTTTTLVSGAPVAPPNIGPATDAIAYGDGTSGGYTGDPVAFRNSFRAALSNGGVAFAGPRDDGFYVDLGGIFDLANILTAREPTDGVSGFNTHSIALEIPITDVIAGGPPTATNVNDVLGVYATASRRKVRVLRNNGTTEDSGPFVQVSRLGLPLINEAVIGLQDKDRWNASGPITDVARFSGYFLNPVIVRDAEAVGIYDALVPPVPASTVTTFKSNRTDILNIISLGLDTNAGFQIGDVLRVDASQDSGFPNGRALQRKSTEGVGDVADNQEQNDVTDTLLTVLLSGGAVAIADGVNRNDRDFLPEFPFLQDPFAGFDEGHGVPAP